MAESEDPSTSTMPTPQTGILKHFSIPAPQSSDLTLNPPAFISAPAIGPPSYAQAVNEFAASVAFPPVKRSAHGPIEAPPWAIGSMLVRRVSIQEIEVVVGWSLDVISIAPIHHKSLSSQTNTPPASMTAVSAIEFPTASLKRVNVGGSIFRPHSMVAPEHCHSSTVMPRYIDGSTNHAQAGSVSMPRSQTIPNSTMAASPIRPTSGGSPPEPRLLRTATIRFKRI